MKKLIVLVLITAVAALSFADDALVLPKGVLRIYETTSYAFATSEYDADGETQDIAGTGDTKFLNIGAALEYGVTDWISAAVQWAPGWNVWSSFGATGAEDWRATGVMDIFAGAKLQIIGAKAPVASETVRFAFAPGVKIPLPGPDWDKQVTNAGAGDPFIVGAVDKHSWGFGARAYFDYVFSPAMYLNLYSEFIYYPLGTPAKETDIFSYMGSVPGDIKYGYDLTLEAEPHYELMLGGGSSRLGFGLPVTLSLTPETETDGVADTDSETTLLTISPSVSLFLMKTVVPLEFKLSYGLPLMGKNTNATNALVLQLKSYLKF